jgi:general transcription factor 3C polypeptide 5 (transcription factor C subunit 1)
VSRRSDGARAALYNRPDDSLSVPITSGIVATNDLLLEVKVPKLIRRKRKRHDEEPPTEDQKAQENQPGDVDSMRPAKRLLRALRDNPDNFTTEVVGKIENTHRFRGRSR